MARGKSTKAAGRRERAGRLDQDTFNHFGREVKAAKQELNDATMAHAGVWKNAEPRGIHPAAAKLYLKLDDMEDTKRADFLRAFDLYRRWADHWRVQADILEEEASTEAAAAERDERDQREAEEAPLDFSEREPAEPQPIPEPAAPEVEADLGEEGAAEATEELAAAGFIFADGRSAAIEGQDVDANPHPEGTAAHPIWARGHAQGTRDKAEAENPETDAGVVPLNGRRSRRAAQEAAVH